MDIHDEGSAATALWNAELDKTARGRITDEWSGLTLDNAYSVQDRLVELKLSHGDRVIGTKLGLTSQAKQLRMGISSPLTAVLLESYRLEHNKIPVSNLIQPRVEPEIVFVMGKRVSGPGVDVQEVLDAVECVYAGLEIIDSRFQDYSFALPDVIADNASSALFLVGELPLSPSEVDLINETVILSLNGNIVSKATGAAVQGNPAHALALAANEIAARGLSIEAGEIILTGGMTDAVALGVGDSVKAEFGNLGTLEVTGI